MLENAPRAYEAGDGWGSSGLQRALGNGRFVVTAEIGPPRGPDPDAIRRKAAALRGWIDAANITDNQSGFARLSSWSGALLALQEGVEPVMQVTCRDRNRIALQSDLLSAAALGIRNVLLISGDHPRFGDHPDAKSVFDIDSVQLIWTAQSMRDHGKLLSGRTLEPPPQLTIGAVENPFSPPTRFRAQRLGKKVAAGAQFVQTQFVFDVEPFERWMAEVRDLGLHERCKILASVGPIRSLRALEHVTTNVPGLHVPEHLERRLRGAPGGDVAEEGLRACVETIQRVRDIPGVAGIHLITFGYESGIPDILERAGAAPATDAIADVPARGALGGRTGAH